MKKIFTLLLCLAAFSAVMAQTRTVYVYIPGDGEHRGGFSISPSFGSRLFAAQFSNGMSDAVNIYEGRRVAPRADLSNNLGFAIEGYWGYDTEHGNAVEWSQIHTIGFRYQAFKGSVTDTFGRPHDVAVSAPSVYFRETPSLIIPLNDQFHLGIGIDVMLDFGLNSGVRVDGDKYAWKEKPSFLENLFTLGVDFGGVLSAEYFVSDEFYVGARFSYNFYSFNIQNLMQDADNDGSTRVTDDYIGAVSLDQGAQQMKVVRFSTVLPFQLGLQVGFRW